MKRFQSSGYGRTHFVYTSVLAGINVTAERIQLNEHLSERTSCLYVLNMLPENSDLPTMYEKYVKRSMLAVMQSLRE